MILDVASPFKSQVFRPIAVLLIPGLIAGLPYALVAGHYFPELSGYREGHEIVYFLILALLVVGVGFVLEDFGTELELVIDQRLIKNKHPDLYEVWYEYLALKFETEPVAQRYLRTVLLRFQFELSTAVSLIVCYAGLGWLSLIDHYFSICSLGWLGLIFLILVLFLTWQAYKGAGVLANLRRVMTGRPAIN